MCYVFQYLKQNLFADSIAFHICFKYSYKISHFYIPPAEGVGHILGFGATWKSRMEKKGMHVNTGKTKILVWAQI